MTCKEIDNLLPAYEEDLLPLEEKKEVEAHLAGCERCRRSLADLRRTRELVQGLHEVEPPPFFEERIMARVREEARGKRGILRRLFYPLHIKVPIQAMATVVVAVLAFHLYHEGEPEMKQVMPLPAHVAESAREPAAIEPPGAAPVPEAAAPARPPAKDLTGATGERFAAPPPERGGKREKIGDSAALREERPKEQPVAEPPAAAAAPKSAAPARPAPEMPMPEPAAKAADSAAARADMAGEEAGRRVEGRAEAPAKAASRQETHRAPAGPAPEHKAKARMADRALTAREERAMPGAAASRQLAAPTAAPAARHTAASEAIGRFTVELTIQVADVPSAVQEIEKRLGEANARIVERRRSGEGEFLRLEMAAGRVPPLLEQLAGIGRVDVKKGQHAPPEGDVTVLISVESRP